MDNLKEAIFYIPWGHNRLIIDKCRDNSHKALFYVHKTIENNWSRAVLLNFLDTDLYERQGKAVTNFSLTLPTEQSDLAQAITKDPYNFDFLTIREKYDEKELKDALMTKIENFLMELGTGFAFMGREVRIEVGNTEKFIDMLFYNTQRHCYVVIEVKTGAFNSSYAGQLGTYVVAINAHSTTKCDSFENDLTRRDDSQDLGQNARDLSRDIAVDEKLNPQTSAWLGSNYEEYKKLDEQGLVDKPNGEQAEKQENQEDKSNTIKGFSERPAYCGDTTRKFEMADGSVQVRTGGTVAWRNNNIGNMKIEYANSCDKTVKSKRTYEKALQDAQKRYDGVVDLDQFGNIVFETPEAGAMAKAKLVLKGHKNETIPQMLRGYAKTDYTGKVDYKSYESTIYKTGDSMGVNLRTDKKISELSDKEKEALLTGMTKHEGVKKGKIEVIPAKKK